MRFFRFALAVGFSCSGFAWAQEAPPYLKLESRVASIHTVFEGLDANANMYRIALRNTSSHAVTDFCFGAIGGDRAINGSHRGYAAIKPGGTFPALAKVEDGLVVLSALFDDGSYEGDPKIALEMAAGEIGKQIQFERIRGRIEAIVASAEADEVKLEAIRSELPKFSEDPQPEMIARIRKEYSTLPIDEEQALFWLRWGLRGVKSGMSAQFEGYVKHRDPNQKLTDLWREMLRIFEPYRPGNPG